MHESLPHYAKSPTTSEATAEVLLNLIEEAIIVVGRDLTILEWNAGAGRMFGWSQDEASGMSIDHLQVPNAETGLREYTQIIFEKGGRWSGEVPFFRKGGTSGLCDAVIILLSGGRALISIRDITKRQQRIEELSRERHLLRTIVDGVTDIIFLKDREGRHILRNRAGREVTGLPDEAVIGKNVTEIGLSPDMASAYHADDMHVIETGEPLLNREESFSGRDKQRGWFLTNKHPIFDSSGRVTGLVGISRDITEQKRASDELNETRLRLSRHLDNSLLAVAELDREGKITRWNERASQIFGWSAADALGKTVQELGVIPPGETERVNAVFERLISGEESHSTSQNKNLTKDGRTLHCRWFNTALRDPSGQIRSFLAMAEDVTTFVDAVEKLSASDRLLTTLIDATNTGYAMLDAQGCIMQVNDKYLSFFGVTTKEELVGQPARRFVAEEHLPFFYAEFARLLREGSAKNVEIDLCSASGIPTPFEINARTEQTSEGLRAHLFYRDITVRRRAIEERQAIEHKMQESQKLESLGVLAGGIAHDFNNLLTGILGHASLASSVVGPDPRIQGYLEQIEKASLRAADLCKQMLAYSGKGRFVVQPNDLNTLLRDTVDLLLLSISKRVVLSFHLAGEIAPIMADATQLRQVIMNLVMNASEAIGEAGGSITVSSGSGDIDAHFLAGTHSTTNVRPGRYVWFEVTDTGCGMSPEIKDRIFDPFFTTKFTGRGLGLAAVLGIVRSHGGALKVDSTPGKGTVFRVLFPSSAGAPAATAHARTAAPWRSSGRVLVVDDEETVRIVSTHILEGLGFTVILATDGRDAVKKFQSDPAIALVLLDLTMPHMDGEETYREIRRMRPATKVLLMSGFSEQEAMSRFASQGLAGFVQKPFNVAQLTAHVREVLE